MRVVAASGWSAIVALIVLTPQVEPAPGGIGSLCVLCGERGVSDAILNVLLFLPLGAFLPARMRTFRTGLLWGALVSLGIELLQIAIPGRFPTLGDIFWNATGAGLGALSYSAVAHALRGSFERRTAMGWASSGGAAVLIVGSGALLGGHLPDSAYFAQWTADLGNMPQYGGRLLEARLDGRDLPSGRFPPNWDIRASLGDDWRLELLVIAGRPPAAVSPIFSIYDDHQREILLVGADGDDLVLRESLQAHRMRMDAPDLRLEGATVGVAEGDTMRITLSRTDHVRRMTLHGHASRDLTFTPGRSWGLLLHLDRLTEPWKRAADAGWLFLLFLPTGLFFHTRRGLGGGLFLLATALAFSLILTRLSALPLNEILGAAAGAMTGVFGREMVAQAGRHHADSRATPRSLTRMPRPPSNRS